MTSRRPDHRGRLFLDTDSGGRTDSGGELGITDLRHVTGFPVLYQQTRGLSARRSAVYVSLHTAVIAILSRRSFLDA